MFTTLHRSWVAGAGLALAAAVVPGSVLAQTFTYDRTVLLHGLRDSGCRFDNTTYLCTPAPITYRAQDSLRIKGVFPGRDGWLIPSDGGAPTVAQRVSLLRDRLGTTTRSVVLGHSMGGVVARSAYFANPTGIAGIVTVSSPLRGAPIVDNADAAKKLIGTMAAQTTRATLRVWDIGGITLLNDAVADILRNYAERRFIDWMKPS